MYGLPDTIKLGTLTYELRWDENIGQDGYRGKHSSDRLLMRIDPKQPEEQARVTLMHECVHAVHMYFALNDDDKEERFTDCTATGIVLLARDNPVLWRWFQGEQIES